MVKKYEKHYPFPFTATILCFRSLIAIEKPVGPSCQQSMVQCSKMPRTTQRHITINIKSAHTTATYYVYIVCDTDVHRNNVTCRYGYCRVIYTRNTVITNRRCSGSSGESIKEFTAFPFTQFQAHLPIPHIGEIKEYGKI